MVFQFNNESIFHDNFNLLGNIVQSANFLCGKNFDKY
eukprot:UN17556